MSGCPLCGERGVPVLFGLPVEVARTAGAAGDLALLGCFEPEDPPHYRCVRGHDWRVADESLWQADVVAALTRHGYREDGDDPEVGQDTVTWEPRGTTTIS